MFDYLKPGCIVKDAAGIRKTIVRVESGKVYWAYADRNGSRCYSAGYERFIDTHFVFPHMTMLQEQAA
jgi:hypothetical protein